VEDRLEGTQEEVTHTEVEEDHLEAEEVDSQE